MHDKVFNIEFLEYLPAEKGGCHDLCAPPAPLLRGP